jgi:hypothetical protein
MIDRSKLAALIAAVGVATASTLYVVVGGSASSLTSIDGGVAIELDGGAVDVVTENETQACADGSRTPLGGGCPP